MLTRLQVSRPRQRPRSSKSRPRPQTPRSRSQPDVAAALPVPDNAQRINQHYFYEALSTRNLFNNRAVTQLLDSDGQSQLNLVVKCCCQCTVVLQHQPRPKQGLDLQGQGRSIQGQDLQRQGR